MFCVFTCVVAMAKQGKMAWTCLRKDDSHCVWSYMVCEVESARPRGRQRKLGRTWLRMVWKVCIWTSLTWLMDHKKWRKLIRGRQVGDDESGDSGWCIFWWMWCQLIWVDSSWAVSPGLSHLRLSHLRCLTWVVSPWAVSPGLPHLRCLTLGCLTFVVLP